jgi:DNA-nicking Smr family endonuclease
MATRRSIEREAAGTPAGDRESFRAAMSDVKPLKAPPRVPARAPQKSKKKRLAASAAASFEQLDARMPIIEAASSEVSVEGALSFQRAGVRTQVMRKLRRGLYPVDAELDLHGLTQAAAREHLAGFIESSRDAGNRCVRIIHGKGYRSGARGPVLKTAVDMWLRRHLDVMAFSSAKAIDGGTGAVYVLLRA